MVLFGALRWNEKCTPGFGVMVHCSQILQWPELCCFNQSEPELGSLRKIIFSRALILQRSRTKPQQGSDLPNITQLGSNWAGRKLDRANSQDPVLAPKHTGLPQSRPLSAVWGTSWVFLTQPGLRRYFLINLCGLKFYNMGVYLFLKSKLRIRLFDRNIFSFPL